MATAVAGQTKTEGGQQYPREAYLLAADPETPSTWKLRIWESLEQKVTVAQLHRVAGQFGRKAAVLSFTERDAALRRLRRLYREAGVPAEKVPPVMQQALSALAIQSLERHARRLAKRMRAEESLLDVLPADLTALHQELAEAITLLDEQAHWISVFSALLDGELSFETIIGALQRALQAQDPTREPKIVATFPGFVVCDKDGKLWQGGYSMEGTDAVLGAEAMEVTAEFEPVPQTQTEHRTTVTGPRELTEERPSSHLREAQLDRDGRVIRNTVVITGESANGVNGRRRYPDAALRQIAQMGEGLPAYANHVPKELAFKPRDVRELIGRHQNVRFDEGRHRVLSDLQVLGSHADWVFDLAEDLGDVVGNSLVSKGVVHLEQDGTEVVDEIVALRSVDLVSDPASTKGLFEHRERWQAGHSAGQEGDMAEVINLSGIQQYLKANAPEAAALKEHLAGAELKELGAAKTAAETALQKEQAAHGETKRTLTEVQVKVDRFEAVEKVREKTGRLETAIAGSELAKKYAATVTPAFRQLLLEGDEAKWPALIEDRVKVLDQAAAGAANQRPESQAKTFQEGELPQGTHAKLAAALVG